MNADPAPICPYCRSEISDRDESVECSSCTAAHHTDCWSDNGGCAVYGCDAAPAEPVEPAVDPKATAQSEASAFIPRVAEVGVQSSTASSSRSTLFASLGILGLALLIAAGAIGYAIASKNAAPAPVTSADRSNVDESNGSQSTDGAADEPIENDSSEPDNKGSGAGTESSGVTTSSTLSGSGYVAQLGSFTQKSEALSFRDKLRGDGMDVEILRSDNIVEFNPGYWVVYAGPFSSRSSAESAAAEGNANGAQGGFARYATPR